VALPLLAASVSLLVSGGCRRAPTDAPATVTPIAPGIDVATRAAGGVARLPAPRFLQLGDRWGCAEFRTEGRITLQCWNTRAEPRPWERGLHAWPVPWLTESKVDLQFEADRICSVTSSGRAERCWRAPVRGESSPHELPVAPPFEEDPPVLAYGPVASAEDMPCVLRQRAVVCHGPGYSPPAAPDAPVTVQFDPGPPLSESAVVQSWSAALDDECLARRGCSRAPALVPRCGSLATARPWSEVLAEADTRVGQTVRVRGALALEPTYRTMIDCGEGGCCNDVGASIVLAGGVTEPLRLDGLSCAGDDSEICCDAPAYGQTVIATGRLEPAGGNAGTANWMLVEPRLCE
jgi:hypothetical protein